MSDSKDHTEQVITISLSQEDAKNAEAAIGHSLSVGVPKERSESIQRARDVIRAAIAAGSEPK